ncbi:STAS domain-containing protein [Streptomyces sp. SAS_276]|uniref:STAS domain-containing protein n=1 Tax=Streptomyces sp. SAS_276 TaxID=3412745 RepID=UPI00403CC43A
MASVRRGADSRASYADRVAIRLSEDITFKNAQAVGTSLWEALRAPPRVLEVDLDRVTYLSSDGGAVFFVALLAARPHGTRVIVTHADAQVRGHPQPTGRAVCPRHLRGRRPGLRLTPPITAWQPAAVPADARP